PRLGFNYAGITCYVNSEAREYIETKLFRVLDPTVNYYVEFWVSLSNESNYAIENIGAYFSIDTLHYSSNLTSLIDAQVEHSGGIISDTLDWVKVSGYFKPPTDGYQFLTIGNFNVSDSTNKTLVGWHSYDGAYYYIDNVAVIDSALQYTIGIESSKFKVQSLKLSVFPNPASSDITLEFSSGLNQDIEIQIYNVMGNKVLSEMRYCQKSVALDVSKLRGGIYFIRVIDESGKVYSDKLIVE
ncbi:MAG: T9SS type A sorting domain-containing protein, partial [Bacteroidales bacterium]|nr:T9SS type A sorting domain-containing protein [Bacteroidales bacterium]